METAFINTEEISAVLGPVVVIAVAIFLLVVSVAVLVIKAVVYCRIFHRAGYHWALGLLMLVPVACLVMPFLLAFGHWPILRELEELRRQQGNLVGEAP